MRTKEEYKLIFEKICKFFSALFRLEFYPGYPDGIITVVLQTSGVICWIWRSRLHPFGGDDPRFIITYLQTAEVAESGTAYTDIKVMPERPTVSNPV